MDKFIDSVSGTLKRLKKTILEEVLEPEEGESCQSGAPDASKKEAGTSKFEQPIVPQLTNHHNDHGHAPTPAVTDKKTSPAPYSSNVKGKNSTLLAISKNPGEGSNSEAGRRNRSMRLAHSMTSVYRKIHKDKNIHNDRHYLMAVAEHLKDGSSVDAKSKEK